MSINLTDEIEVKTKKGKLGAAKQIFLEGDTQTVEKEIQDINSRHNALNTKHESLSRTVQGIAATGGASTATNVTYNKTNSGLNAENVQDAIDKLVNSENIKYNNKTSGINVGNVQEVIDELANKKFDKENIVHEYGESEDKVVSQKAISTELAKKVNAKDIKLANNISICLSNLNDYDLSAITDICITDKLGQEIIAYNNGHIKTKKFDSRLINKIFSFKPFKTNDEHANSQTFGSIGEKIKTSKLQGVNYIYLPKTENGYVLKLRTPKNNIISSLAQTVDTNDIITKIFAKNINKDETVTMSITFNDNDAGIYVNYVAGTLLELSIVEIKDYIDSVTDDVASFSFAENKHLTLCSYVCKFTPEKCPYPVGYLYHKLKNDDGTLYFGTTTENIKKYGQLKGVLPRDCMVGLSPSGSVILTKRGSRGTMYVYKDGNTIPIFKDAAIKPMGWLYNSGCEFFYDENGDEICEFAEYSGTELSGTRYVWRGKAPYDKESDWETVFSMPCEYSAKEDTITHFHMVKIDPWSNAIYLTAGDMPKQLRWWVSTDYGKSFKLLTDNATNGWEEHIGRVINFVFTKDWVYWANDHGTNHCLNKIARNKETKLLDATTRVKICDLRFAQACNSVCLVDSPRGIFLFERIDTGDEYTQFYNSGFYNYFYDLDKEELKEVHHINFKSTLGWGGNRGKCYTEYTTGSMPNPIIGFSIDTPCPFTDLIIDDPSKVGSIQYKLNGTMKFIETNK